MGQPLPMQEGKPAIRLPKRRVAALAAVAITAAGFALAWKAGAIEWLAPAPEPLRVHVVGHRWWWEFAYPDLGIKTANELHIPVGREIQLELTTVDVAHTLSIPELGLQANAIPGAATRVQLRVNDAMEFGGDCSEICGIAHNLMRAKVLAEARDQFAAWVSDQQTPAALPQTEEQRRGYEMVTTACAKCHSLAPAEPRTDLPGPNLAHLMSRSVFAGASFNLNETNLRRWIRDTQEMKAGNDMIVKLPRDDFEAVIEYLLMLR
jgi:cytochrome c oxidase subunit 2